MIRLNDITTKLPVCPGNLLFHCTSSKALFKILETVTFRGGIIVKQNDLRESHLYEQFRFNSAQIYNIIKNYCFSFSFSQNFLGEGSNIPIYGYKKPRMWAQYADNSQGACLIFDKAKFSKAIRELSSDYYIFEKSIKYRYSLDDFLAIKDSENAMDFIINNQDSLFFIKHSDWRDEDEYKYIAISKNTYFKEVPYVKITECLMGIIMGPRFSSDKQLIDLINKNNLANRVNLYVTIGKYGNITALPYYG